MKFFKQNGVTGGMVTSLLFAVVLGLFSLTGCASTEVAQYGVEGDDTITLNLIRDLDVGALYVTHVNGESTGAYIKYGMDYTLKSVPGGKYINPLYIKLTDKPIVFTIRCPIVNENGTIMHKWAELKLTKVSDLKAGDVLTLRWLHQTRTFEFINDTTGDIHQQAIPTFLNTNLSF